jgi:hypothetical protein
MTSPTNDRNLMTLRVTPFERALLDLICEQEGRSTRSSLVRKLILEEAERRNISSAGQPAQAS